MATLKSPEFTDRELVQYAKTDLLKAIQATRPDQISNLVGNFEDEALQSAKDDLIDVTNAVKDWYAAILNAVGDKQSVQDLNDSFDDFIFNGACAVIEDRIEAIGLKLEAAE